MRRYNNSQIVMDIHGMGYERSEQFKRLVRKLALEYTNTPVPKPNPWRII